MFRNCFNFITEVGGFTTNFIMMAIEPAQNVSKCVQNKLNKGSKIHMNDVLDVEYCVNNESCG